MRGFHRHTVNHIERLVVAVERTGATDDNLRRSAGSARRRTDVDTCQLALHGAGKRCCTVGVEVFGGKILHGIAKPLALALHAESGDYYLVESVVGAAELYEKRLVTDMDFLGEHSHV